MLGLVILGEQHQLLPQCTTSGVCFFDREQGPVVGHGAEGRFLAGEGRELADPDGIAGLLLAAGEQENGDARDGAEQKWFFHKQLSAGFTNPPAVRTAAGVPTS